MRGPAPSCGRGPRRSPRSRRGRPRWACSGRRAMPTDPDSRSERQTLPIARRLASRFPLLWRPGAPAVRAPMVGWFDPAQLLSTGTKTLAALIVGERADPRIVQAIAARETELHDYTVRYTDSPAGPLPDRERARAEIWLDYVCDTGDGWNSVYAVAYTAAQPVLELADPAGLRHTTARGELLVFGGDEVYPTPS